MIKNIKFKLTDMQLNLFHRSSFEEFLLIPKYEIQNQVLHVVLLYEIYQIDHNSMWFQFGSDKVRFSILEFALITGLKCYRDDIVCNFIDLNNNGNRLGSLYLKTILWAKIMSLMMMYRRLLGFISLYIACL